MMVHELELVNHTHTRRRYVVVGMCMLYVRVRAYVVSARMLIFVLCKINGGPCAVCVARAVDQS